jgi:hypothetical protein
VIRDNRISRIRGPHNTSGPAILAWQGAEDTVVERNLILDSFRGIALGLRDRHAGRSYDHLRGVVRNNIVFNMEPWADEAIEANGARSARLYHNTVLVRGRVSWSMSVRFTTATADVRNNLTSFGLRARDGGVVLSDDGNVSGATAAWFVHAPSLDFQLAQPGARALDAGVALSGIEEDFHRAPRRSGRSPDAGAVETSSSREP